MNRKWDHLTILEALYSEFYPIPTLKLTNRRISQGKGSYPSITLHIACQSSWQCQRNASLHRKMLAEQAQDCDPYKGLFARLNFLFCHKKTQGYFKKKKKKHGANIILHHKLLKTFPLSLGTRSGRWQWPFSFRWRCYTIERSQTNLRVRTGVGIFHLGKFYRATHLWFVHFYMYIIVGEAK